MSYPTANQWPAHINAISNLPQPAHNMYPQLHCNTPQPIPSVTQPGQWYVPAKNSGYAQGALPQNVLNSRTMSSSHVFNQAVENAGNNDHGYLYDKQDKQYSRGTENFQPISQ